uniref:C2H2-type domain-containing protein n=1 Tax=Seriola lalandi dorsalis TaxID=1841481 RepID=A0A3B4WVV7_SERLL
NFSDPDDEQLFPIFEPTPEQVSGGGGQFHEEEQQHKIELSVEDDGSVGFLCYTGEHTGEEEQQQQEEEESCERQALTPLQEQDHITEPDYEIASRLLPPTVQSDRRSISKPRVSESQGQVDLRICILENSQIEVLSAKVFQQCPVQELQCPRGLEEADFLDLLRSTFPQLAADKPFDFFTTDRRRTLQPLRVKTLTPEEICGTIRSIGAGNSALYIRLKTEEEQRATDEEFHLPQRKEAAADSASDPTRPHPEYLNSSAAADETVQSDRRRRRRRSSKPRSNLDLRIRILEDSQTDVLSTPVFQQCPVQELQCPHGLEEADFLDLLKSTFPQLATDKPFDFFTTDRSRTLQPLRVKTLTPEEICGTIRSIGAGNSALYIRLKPHEKLQVKTNRPPLQRKDVAAKNSPSAPDHTGLNASVGSDRKRLGRPRLSDILNHVDLRIRLLEDSQIKVLSARVFRKYPVQELRCPRGLQEADFLDLLRSTFPQLAADGPFDVLVADRSRMLQPLRVKTLTPEEVSSTMRFFGHSVLYIRLKAPEEKAHLPQGNVDAATDSPSTSDPSGRHSSSVQQQEGNRVDFLFSCSTSEQQGVFTEEADDDDDEDEDCERSRSPSLWSLQCLLLSESEQDEEEVNDGDDDWRPEKTEESLRNKEPEKTTGKRRLERPRVRAKRKRVRSPRPVLTGRNSDAPLSCSICGALRWSTGMLIKHSWSHVDHPERQCGVCGEQSESTEQLRIHLQSHQKTHSCNICGKSFLSTSGYNGHIALHKGEKPHKCKICHKAFTQRGTLVNHMWVHTANKPHKCDICQISCVSKTKLESHRVKHTGESLYSCSTCSKPFRSLQTLSQHMVSHSGRKRLYDCDVCGRKFTSNKRLQSHLRRHSSVPTAADSATNASGAKPSW